jgi:hypothetical protein
MESLTGAAQHRGPSAAEAAAGRADPATGAEGHADISPADVIIGAGQIDGIAVTIAAGSPELRDRFRSAAGDLHAELARLGTEVDSIRVALRAGMSADDPGSGHTGGSGERGLADEGLRDSGLSETGQTDNGRPDWGRQDWGRQDLPLDDLAGAAVLDGSAATGTEADADDAGAAPDADGQTAGNEGRSRDPEAGYQRPDERFRFAFSVQGATRAGALPPGSPESAVLPATITTIQPATQPGSSDAHSRNRIDRYA